jgi:hypothetical protein
MVKNNVLTWDNIADYLESIRMVSDVDINRVREIFSQGKIICPEELKRIFVSNYKESDGKEQFKDLWLFSDNYVIEALNFSALENVKLEMTIFNKNLLSISVEAENYDFSRKAKDESKLHIVFYTLGIFSCDQIAYGVNCDTLMLIFNKYIKHNLVRGQSSALV